MAVNRSLSNCFVEVNKIVVNNNTNKVDIKRESEVLEATGFRAAYKQKEIGIADASVTIQFFLTYGASSVNEILTKAKELTDENKTIEVAVKPFKGFASTSNPLYLMKEAFLPSFSIPFEGPKQLIVVTAEFVNAGESGIEEQTSKREGEAE